jgi:hypothetical protein
MKTLGNFFHRRMSDSTVESICMKCFQTIARGENEFKITEIEMEHSCTSLKERQQHWRESWG